jgi:hypothetical protein
VIKESFRQEEKIKSNAIASIPAVFIGIKNKTKSSKEKKRLKETFRITIVLFHSFILLTKKYTELRVQRKKKD